MSETLELLNPASGLYYNSILGSWLNVQPPASGLASLRKGTSPSPFPLQPNFAQPCREGEKEGGQPVCKSRGRDERNGGPAFGDTGDLKRRRNTNALLPRDDMRGRGVWNTVEPWLERTWSQPGRMVEESNTVLNESPIAPELPPVLEFFCPFFRRLNSVAAICRYVLAHRLFL